MRSSDRWRCLLRYDIIWRVGQTFRKRTWPGEPGGSDAGRLERHLIVGIDASAGGLQAFNTFLPTCPSPAAWHLLFSILTRAPKHASEAVKLLCSATAMPVVEAADNHRVVANHVYSFLRTRRCGPRTGTYGSRSRRRPGSTVGRSARSFIACRRSGRDRPLRQLFWRRQRWHGGFARDERTRWTDDGAGGVRRACDERYANERHRHRACRLRSVDRKASRKADRL